jgi:hypothetical protein
MCLEYAEEILCTHCLKATKLSTVFVCNKRHSDEGLSLIYDCTCSIANELDRCLST